MNMENPRLDLIGVRAKTGKVPPRSAFPAGSLRGAERPLISQFVGALVLPFSMRAIPINNPTIAAGASAWFGLARWALPDDIGQQAVLSGYRIEMGATNPTPAADADFTVAGNNASWGTTNGTGAALVVGLNLPIVEGSWSSGPSNIPYVESSFLSSKGGPSDRMVFHFPKGKLEDNPQPAVYRTNQITPLGLLLTGGTLDVALVVRRAQVHGVTKTPGIVGSIHGELLIASTLTRGEWIE